MAHIYSIHIKATKLRLTREICQRCTYSSIRIYTHARISLSLFLTYSVVPHAETNELQSVTSQNNNLNVAWRPIIIIINIDIIIDVSKNIHACTSHHILLFGDSYLMCVCLFVRWINSARDTVWTNMFYLIIIIITLLYVGTRYSVHHVCQMPTINANNHSNNNNMTPIPMAPYIYYIYS